MGWRWLLAMLCLVCGVGLTMFAGSAAAQENLLQVSNTATSSFTRTYTWGINKAVDKTQQNVPAGGAATFAYTVVVTSDNGTDSDWRVDGLIAITNPNSSAIAGVNVTDMVSNGGACTVEGGTDATVPAKVTLTLAYTCTYSSTPSPSSFTDTAVVTWDQSSVSATSSGDFSPLTSPYKIVDGNVYVSDTLGGLLGSASVADAPMTFTYSHTFSGDPAGTCTSHPNTAAFVTDDTGATGSSSQTVTVCVTTSPGDLSITNVGSPNPVVSGHRLTYTILASNTGGQDASGVIVSNPLPGNVHLVSASTTQGTCTPAKKGGTVKCSVGTLAAGNSATITIVVIATRPGTLKDTATVTATDIKPDADDSATATTTVRGA